MANTKESYFIPRFLGSDELINHLNFVFQRVSDRLDKLEGLRGAAELESKLTIKSDEETIHQLGDD